MSETLDALAIDLAPLLPWQIVAVLGTLAAMLVVRQHFQPQAHARQRRAQIV